MNARWLGCLAVALLATSPRADAEQAAPAPDAPGERRPTDPPAVVKAVPPGPDGRLAKPVPADEQRTPKPVPARPAPDPKATSRADAELRAMTRDPRLGNADRVEGTEAKGLVTFTFDDGPNPDATPAVIDALERYDIPATFFIVTRRLVGKAGEKSRAILKRQLAAGFDIASHSVSHPNLRGASAKRLAAEVDQSIRTLAAEAGREIGMFRAPFGAIDKAGRAWLKKRGLTEAFWSIDTLDWQAKQGDRLRKKVLSMILAQDGGVVLMHDVKPITAAVIAGILDDLEAANCGRLAARIPAIIPVSIHYFLRDNKTPRAIPEDVKKRTEAYRLALPGRCARRPKVAEARPTGDLLFPWGWLVGVR